MLDTELYHDFHLGTPTQRKGAWERKDVKTKAATVQDAILDHFGSLLTNTSIENLYSLLRQIDVYEMYDKVGYTVHKFRKRESITIRDLDHLKELLGK